MKIHTLLVGAFALVAPSSGFVNKKEIVALQKEMHARFLTHENPELSTMNVINCASGGKSCVTNNCMSMGTLATKPWCTAPLSNSSALPGPEDSEGNSLPILAIILDAPMDDLVTKEACSAYMNDTFAQDCLVGSKLKAVVQSMKEDSDDGEACHEMTEGMRVILAGNSSESVEEGTEWMPSTQYNDNQRDIIAQTINGFHLSTYGAELGGAMATAFTTLGLAQADLIATGVGLLPKADPVVTIGTAMAGCLPTFFAEYGVSNADVQSMLGNMLAGVEYNDTDIGTIMAGAYGENWYLSAGMVALSDMETWFETPNEDCPAIAAVQALNPFTDALGNYAADNATDTEIAITMGAGLAAGCQLAIAKIQGVPDATTGANPEVASNAGCAIFGMSQKSPGFLAGLSAMSFTLDNLYELEDSKYNMETRCGAVSVDLTGQFPDFQTAAPTSSPTLPTYQPTASPTTPTVSQPPPTTELNGASGLVQSALLMAVLVVGPRVL